MGREEIHEKILRDYQGVDVTINYTRYYWVDSRHTVLNIRSLLLICGTKRATIDRFRSAIEVVVNV